MATALLVTLIVLAWATAIWWKTMTTLKNWVTRIVQALAHNAIATALAGGVEPKEIPTHLKGPG